MIFQHLADALLGYLVLKIIFVSFIGETFLHINNPFIFLKCTLIEIIILFIGKHVDLVQEFLHHSIELIVLV